MRVPTELRRAQQREYQIRATTGGVNDRIFRGESTRENIVERVGT
jgi:hypothetical protein